MNIDSADISKQLRSIRRLAWAQFALMLVLVVFLFSLGLHWHTRLSSAQPSTYQSNIASLGSSGQHERALELSLQRIADYPADPYGYYHAGMALYRLAKYEEAIPYLEKAGQLVPAWKDRYTDTLIESARIKLSGSAQQDESTVPSEAAPSAPSDAR